MGHNRKPNNRKDINTNMTFEEALAWIESTLQSQIDKQLTEPEKAILKAAWEQKTYSTVADNLFLSLGYVKDLASLLWKCLSNLLEAKVTKSNFRYLFLEGSTTSNHILPEIGAWDIYQREDSKGKILIVDQFIDNLDFLTYALSTQGYKVQNATDSNLALRTVRNYPPNVILMEINLPECNGYQLCSTLKANKETSEIPIMFLSSSNDVSNKVKAFQVGGVDYITKPCQPEEVVVRIQSQINIQQEKQLLQQKIIQHQQTAEILSQSRALLASVLNNSRDGMAAMEVVRDPLTGEIKDFHYLLVNPIFAKLLGKKREDFDSKSGQKKLLNRLAPLFDKFVQVVETGETLEQEFCWINDTEKKWYVLIAVKLGDFISITVREVMGHTRLI